MDKRSGWAEKRQHERVVATLKMEYHIVSGPDAQRLLSQADYSQTTVDQLPKLSERSSLYRAVTKDISMGGLALVSQNTLKPGMLLEVSLHLPNYKVDLKFLAEIRHVETTVEMGKTLHHAGIRTLAIHKGDVDRIAHYLTDPKNLDL
ncbi:MAG TPA: PilZ domain-containing protein [bacterium]|nr:PilZ domain-containing protein [bacterium]